MLNKYWTSIILLLHLFFFQNLFGQKSYEDFAQKYKGMGSLSEMIMSHKCIIRKNFNLFYETTIKKSEEDRTLIWYKFVFHQPCFISFTIIPNNENDRYDLEVYKIKNNIKLCNTTVDSIFTKVDSLSKDVVYTDNFQSTSFRGSLFNSKQIEVTYNEAIYILVNNLSGPDLGHVIDLQTCDYSYVLKVNKEIIKTDAEDELEYLRKEFSAPLDRLKSIADKLCANSNDKKMGYSNFLGDAMATKNLNSTQVDSASVVQAKAIRKFDSLAGKPAPEVVIKKKENLTVKKITPKPPVTKVDSLLTAIKPKNVKDSVKTNTIVTTKTKTTVVDSLKNKFISKRDTLLIPDSISEKNKKAKTKTEVNDGINEYTKTKKNVKDSISTNTSLTTKTKTTIVDSLKNKLFTKNDTLLVTDSINENRKKAIIKTEINDGINDDTKTKTALQDSISTRTSITTTTETKTTFFNRLKNKFFTKKDTLLKTDSISEKRKKAIIKTEVNYGINEDTETKTTLKDSISTNTTITTITETKTTIVDSLKNKFFTKKDTLLKTDSISEKRKKPIIKSEVNYGINEDTETKTTLKDSISTNTTITTITETKTTIVDSLKYKLLTKRDTLLETDSISEKRKKAIIKTEVNYGINDETEANTNLKDSISTNTTITTITTTKTTIVDSLKYKLLTKRDTIVETNSTIEKRKKSIIKTEVSYGIGYPSIFLKSDVISSVVDTSRVSSVTSKYSFLLRDSIFDVINEQNLVRENSKKNTVKKIKLPRKPILIYFSIIDANTKKIIPNPKLKFYKKNNSKNDILVYHDSICSYSSEFLNSNKWILKCDLFGYLPYEAYFDYTKCTNVGNQLYYLILVSPLKKGDKLALPNVFFHPNSISLKQKSYKELDKLVDYLNSNPAKISINGHTQGNHRIDNVGKTVEEQYRFKGSASKLSKKRAEIVYNYLIEKGIPKERLTIKGYAGRKPIVKHPKNKTERELNMRVEIKIMDINKKYATEKALQNK